VRDVGEAGCYGASLLARSAFENIPAENILQQSRTESEFFTPNPGNANTYERIFEIYKQLYPALKSFWKAR
jgi:sugar (pentulose or hexulose) kinase